MQTNHQLHNGLINNMADRVTKKKYSHKLQKIELATHKKKIF